MSNMPRDDEGEFLPARRIQPLPAAYQRQPQVAPGPASETDDVTLLMHYLRVLWKRKGILLLCTTLGILVGFGTSLWTTPLYYARTTLEIQENAEPLVPSASGVSDVGTKIELLRGRTLANRVEKKLSDRTLPPPKTQDPLSSVRRFLGFNDPTQSIVWSDAVAIAAGGRKISRKGDSRILSIESLSPNPQAAAEFTNTLAEEFIAQGREERKESYRGSEEWLSGAQAELRAKVEESERRLVNFAKSNGLVVTGSEDAAEDKLKQLGSELGRAVADRIAKQGIYEASTGPTEGASLPEVLDSGPITLYETKLTELRQQLVSLGSTLTDQHPTLVKIQLQIKELETAKENERKSILKRIKIDYDAAARREERLEQDFKKQAQVLSNLGEPLLQYKMLLGEVETNRRLHEETMRQGKQVNVASALRASNARIIDTASASLVPDTPNLTLYLGLGGFGGIFCGTILLIGLSVADARIQDCGSLEMQLGLRELGVIPSASASALQTGENLYRSLKGNTQGSDNNPKTALIPKRSGRSRENLELVTWTHRSSVMSESVRAVMTSILFSSNGHGPQTIVITSPNKQEGKTTVTTNLAIALAEINRRVLLIDADMRLPRIHQIFDLPNTSGLSDFLHERRPIEEYHEEELVRKTHVPNLYAMLAGPARSNLARLLYSTRMKELILRFRGTFDMILIDSAPVLLVPDARILGRSADGIILVIRAHKTRQEAAIAAIRSFEDDGSRILGTIFNDWNPKRSAYGTYGAYGSYGAYES